MPETQIIFIHGLANKPEPAQLKRIWLESLAADRKENPGFDILTEGVHESFVYWADLFYDKPIESSQYENIEDELANSVADVGKLASNDWTEKMRRKFKLDEEHPFEDIEEDNAPTYERVWLPSKLKKKLMQSFVVEAHDYLFDKNGVRGEIQKRVIKQITKAKEKGRRIVLLGHSQGSFIAYDVLTGVKDCPEIDGFLTMGSPLGVDEVQDGLVWTRSEGFPRKVIGDWINVYDPLDPVAGFDPKLANDFKMNNEKKVIDVKEYNWGKWRHSATKYFSGIKLRTHLRALADRQEN